MHTFPHFLVPPFPALLNPINTTYVIFVRGIYKSAAAAPAAETNKTKSASFYADLDK